MKIKVLLVIESCNPELSSVPLVGYNFYKVISDFADVHLVTHCRNKDALWRAGHTTDITYYEQSRTEVIYYKLIAFLTNFRGRTVWPLRHLLQFPIYFFFNRFVDQEFSGSVANGDYEIVHALTPIMPRYPYSIAAACRKSEREAKFILGPVNGGVPYPAAFRNIGRQEFSYFNWIRSVGTWLVPGYRSTYKHADVILTGSSYTDSWLKKIFPSQSANMHLMYENAANEMFYTSAMQIGEGADSGSFSNDTSNSQGSTFKLLFLGRLEPYKGCDMVLEALSELSDTDKDNLQFTIVGDGSQRKQLTDYVANHKLTALVTFKGWIPHSDVPAECKDADLFCFPSVREFGGAVVMESMAAGTPCIVVNNGGIGEYVTENSGFKIEPISREHVVQQLAEKIRFLKSNPKKLFEMSLVARKQAELYSWKNKGSALEKIYRQAITSSEVESIELVTQG
ncbi:glycosyltransferase family 4 protein [Microbulbifer agarilyticus]|uniref:glycosyltransferase family 4 protein n=1 Tax=Microbulbifer agarilyticus TaxID=260552 RepID=UPI001CD65AD8|nr:glycosyltransferase family 4 protein [Microbulbifer agarilyticus]MCA0893644.1 glycosyltransferase family 4 protein [Microbulbifer agarilyticus]